MAEEKKINRDLVEAVQYLVRSSQLLSVYLNDQFSDFPPSVLSIQDTEDDIERMLRRIRERINGALRD